MQYAPYGVSYYKGRGSQSEAGKRVIGYPLSRNSTTYVGRVTNKMALKVVGTNKVCESRSVCNRPPTDRHAPSHCTAERGRHKTWRRDR